MGKFFALVLVFFGIAFSQASTLSFQTVHRFQFVYKCNEAALYTNEAEKTTFSFYFDRDTSKASFFLHTTPDIASKYYLLGTPVVTDSTFELFVKSDAGNVYVYKFNPTLGYIYAKDLTKNESGKVVSSYVTMFVMPEPVSVDFDKIYKN